MQAPRRGGGVGISSPVGWVRAMAGQEAGRRQGPLYPALWFPHDGGGEERGGGGKLNRKGRDPRLIIRGGGPRRLTTGGGSC